MKKFRILAIIALVVVIGFSLASCGGDDGGNSGGGGSSGSGIPSIDGVWDRGDIVVTISRNRGLFTDIKNNSYWFTVQQHGNVKIRDQKFRNVRKTGTYTYSCEELTFDRSDYTTSWVFNVTMAISTDGRTLQTSTVGGNDIQNVTYTRR